MTESDARRALADCDVVLAVQGSMNDIKELLSRCLAADIPATIDRPPAAGKG